MSEHDDARALAPRSSSSSSGRASTSSGEGESVPKKPRYMCAFHPESNTYDWARVSQKGPSYAFCSFCKRDISVAYGGRKT